MPLPAFYTVAPKNRIGGNGDSKTLPDVSQDMVAVGLMMNFFYKFTAVSDSEGLLTVSRCFVHLQVGMYVFVYCRSSSVFPPRCTLLYSVSQSVNQRVVYFILQLICWIS